MSKHFHVSMKNWYFASYGSLAYNWVLSISGCWFIRLNNEFVFPDQEPPVINVLNEWSGIFGQFGLCSLIFYLNNIIKNNYFLHRFITFQRLFSSFFLTRSFLVSYPYVSIRSTNCILLSSFELKAILLIS